MKQNKMKATKLLIIQEIIVHDKSYVMDSSNLILTRSAASILPIVVCCRKAFISPYLANTDIVDHKVYFDVRTDVFVQIDKRL